MMHLTKEESNIFATPISQYNLSTIPVENLLAAIETFREYDYGLVDNGISSYPADGKFTTFLLNEVPEIKEVIQQCVNDYTDKLGLNSVRVGTSWFNKTSKGGKLELHRHDGSIVSGGFYPSLKGEVSPLLFKSPIQPYKMLEWFKEGTEYSNIFHAVQPYQGLLVLFPSWLEHKTDKEIGNRLTVSFNTEYVN